MSDPRSPGDKADEQLASLLSGGEDFADPALLLKVSYPTFKNPGDEEETTDVILRMFKPGVGTPKKVEGWMMEVLHHAGHTIQTLQTIVGSMLLKEQIEQDQRRRKAEQKAREPQHLPNTTFDPGLKKN